MNLVDGRSVKVPLRRDCDVVVVGSGPAGSAVARTCARAGAKVVVVEAGHRYFPHEFAPDSFTAMAQLYRDMGATVTLGRAPLPYLQGQAVGGTSVVNGAISWRLPHDVYLNWLAGDPAIEQAWPWQRLEQVTDDLIAELHIAPTDPAVAGPKNLLLAKGAEILGLEHRPISRNVHGCRGSGRCLQGCPHGAKQSMDQSLLPDACRYGAEILAGCAVHTLVRQGSRAVGVGGTTAGGGRFEVHAAKVVLACSAIQTPCLLRRNGLDRGPVGDGFQCHPGGAVAGRFAEPVRMWQGATQGHEVIGLRTEGIKFEALGFDYTILASRLPGAGSTWAANIDDMAHWLDWGAAIKAQARGKVRPMGSGARVHYDLVEQDVFKLRKGISVLGQMMLAAGAQFVVPGVHGFDAQVTDINRMSELQTVGPLDARAYHMAATHLFGTCRAASSAQVGVVGLDFQHHEVKGLYVADSSIFPSNTGVNPQTSILALATLCGNNLTRGGNADRLGKFDLESST